MTCYIYLDTSFLQKWQNKTLSQRSMTYLNGLRNSEDYFFVLSFIYIDELCKRKDHNKALEIAKFLDTLPIIWLKNSVELEYLDIRKASNKFLNYLDLNLSPFCRDYIDTHKSTLTSLQMNHPFKGSSIVDIVSCLLENQKLKAMKCDDPETIKKWGRNETQYIEDNTQEHLNKQQKLALKNKLITNEFKNCLKKKVKEVKENFNLNYECKDFINYLFENLHLIPSFSINYFTEKRAHAFQNRDKEPNDLCDLVHLYALPYVDLILCDNNTCEQVIQAIKYIKKNICSEYKMFENRVFCKENNICTKLEELINN